MHKGNEASTAIEVHSFDFDGCFLHPNYLNSDESDIVQGNATLLEKIKQSALDSGRHLVMFIGSNRQSKGIDDHNAAMRLQYGAKDISCFTAMSKVSNFLGGKFDTLLMADIYGKRPSGTSFGQALKATAPFYQALATGKSFVEAMKCGAIYDKQQGWLFDESKLTILYAQTHKSAVDYPGSNIIFNFYDDRLNILTRLQSYFKENKHQLPENLQLNLHQYTGGESKLIDTIQGSGVVDSNYQDTVLAMADRVYQDPDHPGVTQFDEDARCDFIECMLRTAPKNESLQPLSHPTEATVFCNTDPQSSPPGNDSDASAFTAT